MVADKVDLEATARALNTAAIHLLRGLRTVDRRSGLTDARLSALSVIVFAGAQPLGRLARIEGVTSPTMTRVVDGLEALGLASREPHPDHIRMVMVVATNDGRDLMTAAAQRRVDVIVSALRATPESERETICAAADALVALPRRLAVT